MGTMNQLKKMFDPSRLIATIVFLGEGVDGRRQRLRLARDVGDESDGGAEFAQRLGEAQ